MTFAWLKKAVAYAAHNVQVGHWKNKSTADTYLQTCSVPPKIQQKVYDNFHPSKRGVNGPGVESIFPDIWKSLMLITMFIECDMHHILEELSTNAFMFWTHS